MYYRLLADLQDFVCPFNGRVVEDLEEGIAFLLTEVFVVEGKILTSRKLISKFKRE